MIDEEQELLKLRIMNNKLKSHEFDENEKIIGIRKSNQVLLDKLLEISKGKWSSVGRKGVNVPAAKKVGPKSLNYLNKKRELQRIDQENIKMMNRIVNQGSILNTRKLEQEHRER